MSREYCDFLIDALTPWAPVRARAMFGGFGLYKADLMFGLVADEVLYLKVDDTNRADYEAAGTGPFTYSSNGKTRSMSYWQVPAEVLEDEEIFAQWAEKAFAVALQAKRKPKAKTKAKK